ncbi:F0F1 ATP synthase subunit B family protein [Caldovatus aquaticus]|uniref:ATP synthase subunit b n=1 Tax=Caldovatus aquaticus TaxID=2865671 RepID=A0ABS7F711_9PROT|nr:F0F1 ATP synthase subunit B' [Caldovatus aquaticus]MBW8271404.1 F0F1 ATP synthase subunit B' [Caldovatus aquaticus]
MTRWIRPAATALACLLGAPGTGALAAEPQAQSGGMPQLDFGNPLMIAQVVWLLLIFGLLYFLMANHALPRVGEILEERRRRIAADLEAARAAKAEADAAAAAHREATLRARAEAQAAVANALQEAQAEAQRRAEALNARLAEQIAAAEARIGAARDAAMAALRQVATETAEALVARLVGRADRAAVEAAVARELARRRQEA